MEFLKNTEKFIVFKESLEKEDREKNLTLYVSKLVSWIERMIFNRISKRVNFLLTRINDSRMEIVASGNSDKDEDDNWRITESSGDLIIEKRVSGTWTEVKKFHG